MVYFREEQQSCCWKNILNWLWPIRQENIFLENVYLTLKKDFLLLLSVIASDLLVKRRDIKVWQTWLNLWLNIWTPIKNFSGCEGHWKDVVQKWKESCYCSVVSLHQVPTENQWVQVAKVKETASDKKTLGSSNVKEDWRGLYWENGVKVGWGGGHFRPASETSGVVSQMNCASIPNRFCLNPTTSKHTSFIGSFEEDTAKNEGIDGCHWQV